MSDHYQIRLADRTRRDLDRLSKRMLKQVGEALSELENAPRGVGTRKLIGANGVWRKRVGNFRILYEINDDNREVTIYRIVDRKDAY